MRRIALIGLGILAATAVILVPAGARGALSDGQTFSASVGTINVNCAAGATTGTATYTVSVTSGGSGTISNGANQIRVYRDGSTTSLTSLNDIPESKTITESSFPCPATSSVDGSVSLKFQPYKTSGGGSNQGTSVTITATTHRTGSAS